MINGVLVSKRAKRFVDYVGETKKTTQSESEPEIIDLQEYAKSSKAAASVPSINKARVIHDFIESTNTDS